MDRLRRKPPSRLVFVCATLSLSVRRPSKVALHVRASGQSMWMISTLVQCMNVAPPNEVAEALDHASGVPRSR